jgi:hypothetical protein
VALRGIRIAEARVRFSLGPPDRKLQARDSRLASLGDQIVRNFGRKKSVGDSAFWEKKIFNHTFFSVGKKDNGLNNNLLKSLII